MSDGSDSNAAVVNLKDFGAVGDGVTDDTAAIRAAFLFASGRPGAGVKIPPGKYLLSESLPPTPPALGEIAKDADGQ